ncbi:MAG: MFS transporter [Nitrospinaceae bacterium]|jgi:MFS transporter, FSR family, fosmidomycin resistance protein|nr:MFS transporter [Nitrospinaceae bacterium]MBT4430598.1 MFS transporter [Nitrospinaceae bacterium]MBT5948585.1 MFS transporter [Nitrospinaceae bacterium]MBT6395539.1 MFS transporter [Nitrospinaceae bacterium]MBT7855818.1 MFS transporter [Nitrospinaceae bacterium]
MSHDINEKNETENELAPWGAIGLLFLAHFVVDSQISFLSPLLPLLSEKFNIDLGAAGVLVGLLAFFVAGTQLFTAIITDRWPRLPWLAIGLIGSSFFMTAVGWLPSYTWVAISIPIGGVLAGIAHPDMASRAGSLSDRHRSLAVSFFVSGGRLGFSLGPIIALFIAKWWGMEWLWLYIFVNIVAVIGILSGLPKPEAAKSHDKDIFRGLGAALWKARHPLSILLGVTISRAVVTVNMQGLLPTLYVEMGLGLWQGGIANSLLLFFGMAGVMVGGALANRLGKRQIIVSGIAISILSLVGFLAATPGLALVFLSILGFGLYMPMGVGMAYAQEFLPLHRGFASSLTLGASWGVASISVIPLTWVAEDIGLLLTFWALPICLVIGMGFAFFLPDEKKFS